MLDYSLISFVTYLVMTLIISLLLLKSKKETSIQELDYLILGFIFISFSQLQYSGTVFLKGSSNETLTLQFFQYCSFISVILGWNFLLFGFTKITESSIPKRYYVYFINNTIIIPLIFTLHVQIKWENDLWIIKYTPTYTIFFVLLGITALITETTMLFGQISVYSKIQTIWYYYCLYSFFIFISIPIFLMRGVFITSPNLWLIPVSIAFLVFAVLIYKFPEVFQTSTVYPLFLLILQSDSGVAVKIYHFVENPALEINQVLMASAISALQHVFRNLKGIDSQISFVGFEEFYITIQSSGRYLFLLASEKESAALNSILDRIKTKWDRYIEYFISKEDEEYLDSIVENAFVHQLNRLRLFISEK